MFLEPWLLFCSGVLGAFFGCVIMAFTARKAQKDFIKLLEHYWNTDIKKLQHEIRTLKNI